MYVELRERLGARGSKVVTAVSGWSLQVDDVTVRLSGPPDPLQLTEGSQPWQARGGPPSGDELNAGSLVAVASVRGVEFLLPGDAEAEVLEGYHFPPCEVLVVPHHGSRGAVSGRLLRALTPALAVVSVGVGNSFGHPDAQTMDLLEQNVPTVLRTDHSGWVSCVVQTEGIAVRAERLPKP